MPTKQDKRLTVNLSQREFDAHVAPRLRPGETFSNFIRRLLKLGKLERGGNGNNQYTVAKRCRDDSDNRAT